MINLVTNGLQHFAASCGSPGFFGFPTWYQYLPHKLNSSVHPAVCEISFSPPGDFLNIALAFLDIALRIAGLVAIGFVVYGGIRYVTSQGEPTETAKAKSTIIDALIGLVIALIAVNFVRFLGSKLG